jgi:uncharacterized damage-inducible protein DinB
MALKDALLAEFDHEIGSTRRLLERVPDHKLAWKPHGKSRSMGELAAHLAGLPAWAEVIVNREFFDLADGPPSHVDSHSCEEIVAAFNASAAAARGCLDRTDGELEAAWTLKRQGQNVFVVPRIMALRTFILHHMIHHRGQLSVYLRLNDIAVPSIYGPSADEG